MRGLRKNKMRMSMQKKVTRVNDGDAADTYLPKQKKVRKLKEINEGDAAEYLPEQKKVRRVEEMNDGDAALFFPEKKKLRIVE